MKTLQEVTVGASRASAGDFGNSAKITLVSNAITVDVPDMSPMAESILKSLPAHFPELALADVRTHGNGVTALYIPANEPNDGRTPNLMMITISSYDSEEEAQRGVEKGLFTTSAAPSQKETRSAALPFTNGMNMGRTESFFRSAGLLSVYRR